jgi:hypothetical protein
MHTYVVEVIAEDLYIYIISSFLKAHLTNVKYKKAKRRGEG